GHKSRQSLVQLLNQRVLPQNAFVVHIPAGAVEEVQIVRNLDEPHARFHQPPREQAPLPELAAIRISQTARLLTELEDPLELRTRQAERVADRRVVLRDKLVALLPRQIL